MIKIDYIGGINEDYMIVPRDLGRDCLTLSLEEVQDMIHQFYLLLKPGQLAKAVFPTSLDVEKYYKEEYYQNET